MRGTDETSGARFRSVDLEDRIPVKPPRARSGRWSMTRSPASTRCRRASQEIARPSASDRRATRHDGDALSLKHRTRIDLRRDNDPRDRCLILLTFGWAKTVGNLDLPGLCGARFAHVPGRSFKGDGALEAV